MSENCPFCNLDRPALIESELTVAFEDRFPAVPGHVLVIPRRHCSSYFDCDPAEQSALWAMVADVRNILHERFSSDGFNVGFNVGAAAGQTVFHAHIHVIPRRTGDVANPRGGVRHAVMGHGYP